MQVGDKVVAVRPITSDDLFNNTSKHYVYISEGNILTVTALLGDSQLFDMVVKTRTGTTWAVKNEWFKKQEDKNMYVATIIVKADSRGELIEQIESVAELLDDMKLLNLQRKHQLTL